MAQAWIQRAFAPLKANLPRWLSDPIRSLATALLTPLMFSWRSGHFRSSFARAAVTRRGAPLPWYTYPAIDLLKHRSYAGRSVLEFGAGQSTLWWAERAARVVAFEGDADWHARLVARRPTNVELHLVTMADAEACAAAVRAGLAAAPAARFDVVVIDGLWRYAMIAIAAEVVAPDGVIICDNAERYGFREGFLDRGFQRVDLFGYAPGCVLPSCTSVYFRAGAFLFDPAHPLPEPTEDQD